MDRKTFFKKFAEILSSKPPATKGLTVFKTVLWFIVTIHVAYVISDGFAESVFRKEYARFHFVLLFTSILIIENWRRYFKQRRNA
jgi:hypothetical protein